MFHLWRARSAFLLSFAGSLLLQPLCLAQTRPTGDAAAVTVKGEVTDPSGARIAHAGIAVVGAAASQQTAADAFGQFTFTLPVGRYELTVTAPGFTPFSISIAVDGKPLHLEVPLAIAVPPEQIAVPIDGGTSGDSNAGALVFKGADLDVFSDDEETFQKEIAALAGGSGAQFLVNGFSGGRVPPKSTIREIRIGHNPYSALYDKLGYGRVDISTRAGGDTLHGSLLVGGNDSAFNAQNPYTPSQPPYYVLDTAGTLSGPLGKKSTFFLFGDEFLQNYNAIVNAYTLGANPQPLSTAVPSPTRLLTWNTSADRQFTPSNLFTGQYNFVQQSLTNGGLSGQVLPEAAYNNGTTTQTLQLSDVHTMNAKLVTESRFQYIRTRLRQNALGSAPSIVVQGISTGGGAATQSLVDNQDFFEFQQLLSADRGPHFLRFGARYRLARDANLSTANYNGQYIFPTLAAFQAQTPSQFSVTAGRPSAAILTGDLGAYAEDEWKVARNLTLDFGFRVESQSAIDDHLDLAPRFGFAWAIQHKKKTVLTLRGGSGLFFDRFAAANLLTSVRQNGITQQTYIVANPCFSASGPPPSTPPPCPSVTATPPTSYTVDPALKIQTHFTSGITLERLLGKRGRISVTYYYDRGVHMDLSQNINAPLNGTRPLGGSQNIYRFTSNGILKENILSSNFQLQAAKRLSLWGYGGLDFGSADAAGATTFASNSFNPSQDFGRLAQIQSQIFAGGTVKLPLKINSDVYATAQSGVPFNITTGTDLNGDSIYNDRPAYATAPTAASILYKTPFGTFDANPQPGEPIIPINAGNSPNFYYLQIAARRKFAVGPRPAAPAPKPGAKPGPPPARPWQLGFTVEAANVLNHPNPGLPVGVLNSPYFGKSISLANPLSANPAANRTVTLRASFTF